MHTSIEHLLPKSKNHNYLYPLILLVLVLFICIPLFQPGFYFNLDGSFPPFIAKPNIATTGFFWVSILYGLNKIFPADIIQKIVYIDILLFVSLGSYFVAPFPSKKAKLFFALVVTFNPFVYSRFLSGQYAVLLGYGLFSHLCLHLFFTKKPSQLQLVLLFTALYVVSTHFFVLAVGVVFIWPFVLYFTTKTFDAGIYKAFIPTILLVIIHFLFLGKNPSNMQTFSSFDRWNLGIFATLADESKGLLFNIFSLHGFWFEGEGTILTLKQTIGIWPVITVFYMGLSLYGFMLFLKRESLRQKIGAYYYGAILIGGLVLSVGIASTALAPYIFQLYEAFPLLFVFREPAKLIGLLAFFYAFFGAYAVANANISRKMGNILVLCAGIYYFGFIGGFFTEIAVHPYPKEWYSLQAELTRAKSTKSVLFPWEMYMPLSVGNGKNIFNVAQTIFLKPPTIGLQSLRITPSKKPIQTPEEMHITGLLRMLFTRTNLFDAPTEKGLRLSDGLAQIEVDHVVLLKEFDWKLYAKEFEKDTGLIKIMENDKGMIYVVDSAMR